MVCLARDLSGWCRASSDSAAIKAEAHLLPTPSFATTALLCSRNLPPSLLHPHHLSHPPNPSAIMNAFRVARAARPAFNTLRAVQRRGYADVAADKIQLSLALPHQVRLGRWRG